MMYDSHMNLTFSIGLAISPIDLHAAVLFSPFAIFCLFHVVLLGVVIHQLAVREDNRSQVIGKGVLAEVVWLVSSLIVLFIRFGYMMSFIGDEPGISRSPLALVLIGATSVSYGLVGWGLFRWVRNPGNEELGMWERGHWRNQ